MNDASISVACLDELIVGDIKDYAQSLFETAGYFVELKDILISQKPQSAIATTEYWVNFKGYYE